LPTAGLLDRLEAGHQPPATTFTAVGYGTVREDETGGPHGFLESDKTYRLDTAAAREFLAPFVTLP
jgi:hypothetical protein